MFKNLKYEKDIEEMLKRKWEERRNELKKMNPQLDIKFRVNFLKKKDMIKSVQFRELKELIEDKLAQPFYSLSASCELVLEYYLFTDEITTSMKDSIENKLDMTLRPNTSPKNQRWIFLDDISMYLNLAQKALDFYDTHEIGDNVFDICEVLKSKDLKTIDVNQCYSLYTNLKYFGITGLLFKKLETYLLRD